MIFWSVWGAVIVSTNHSRSVVMCSLYWTILLEAIGSRIILGLRIDTLCSAWCWWMVHFHSWWEIVLQENTSRLIILIILFPIRLTSDPWSVTTSLWIWSLASKVLPANTSTRWNWMMMRRPNTILIEMMIRDPIPIWMLLGSCSPWVEEVIDALECSTTLAWNLVLLIDWVL